MRFPLTHRPSAKDTVEVRCGIATPHRPDAFSQYLSGNVRRAAR